MIRILIAIVTYNPDIDKFGTNIKQLYDQCEDIIVFDNNSDNVNDIKKICNNYPKVIVVVNKINIGLPINYNYALKYAVKNKFKWLLIMDQDTLVPDNLICTYYNVINQFDTDNDIAIVCPSCYDNNLKCNLETISKNEFDYVDSCISSASLNSVEILDKLGGFDENLFIDMVDIEYCKRVILNRFRILKINQCCINHEIGESCWKSIFGKKICVYNHSSFRKYYIIRNQIYFIRKFNLNFLTGRKEFKRLLISILMIFFENDKLAKFKSVFIGIKDGLKMKVSKYCD